MREQDLLETGVISLISSVMEWRVWEKFVVWVVMMLVCVDLPVCLLPCERLRSAPLDRHRQFTYLN